MTLFANAQNYEITFVGLQDDNVVTADPPADGYSIAAGENYVFSIALGSCQESIASVVVDSEELTSNEGKYTIENVQEDKTVTVTFNKYSYLVTATLLEGAHGSVAEGSASQNIECGSDCTVTFVPDENYQLNQILVDGEVATEGVNGNSITLTNVTATHSVSATFEEIPATPTFEMTFSGLQDDNVVTVYPAADNYILEQGADFVFSIALGDCQEAIASVMIGEVALTAEDGKYTVADVQNDTTITVTFTKYSYTVTATLGDGVHGSVAEGSASQNIECGSDCTVTFVPDENYQLNQILVDGEVATEGVNGNSITLTNVRAEHSVSATFEEIPATPTFEMTFSGLQDDNVVTVYPAADNYIVEQGADFVFSIALGDCQEAIASVMIGEVALTAEDGKYTVANVQNDTTITVTFTKYSYTVTATVAEGAHGAVAEGSASQNIECGSDCIVTFVPDENYQLATVTVDGEPVTEGIDGNTFALTNVRAEHSVSATFEEIPEVPEVNIFGMTFVGLEEGNVITVPENARVDSVMRDENYVFGITLTECQEAVASVTVGGVVLTADESNQYTIENVQSDTTIAVAFIKYSYTVTATVAEGEHGAVAEGFATNDVECGSDYAITFVPEENYQLASVVVDEGEAMTEGIDGNTFTLTNVRAEHSVSATFEEIPVVPEVNIFGITFVGLEEGNVITVPENARVDSVMRGENYVFGITLTACQEAIASVTVGDEVLAANESNQYTIENIQSDTIITVAFTKYSYTITAVVEEGEHGAVAEGFATNDVECGSNYTITFVPEDGYILDSVVVDTIYVTEGMGRNSFTLTNVTAAHTVKGYFGVDPSLGNMYAVTFAGLGVNDTIIVPVTVDSSYVHTSAVADSVLYGEDFVFAINPESCHYIDSVSVNGVAIEADNEGYYSVNVIENTTITVAFLTYRYTVTASAGEHGRLASDAEAVFDCGTSYTLSFVPEAGYRLGSVLLDGESTTEGINGNTYTLVVDADHTVHGEFVEFRGPYVEYVNLESDHEVGDTIGFSLKMHANCMFENLCGVGYELTYVDTTGTSSAITDATKYGVFSYNVNVTDEDFVTNAIQTGSGMLTYTLEQGEETYNVGAFTLGLFDEAAGRDRTVDYTMMFTRSGRYQIKTTLYTCSNGGDAIGTDFVAAECDDIAHNDRVAETCSNPRVTYEITGEINISGATIHTITTTVLGGHGTVEPEGTIIVEAGTRHEIVFTPDEYYALDTVMVNGIMRYPTISQVQYVIDSVYTIDSITENYNITVKFKDVRPYYNVHVEVTTAGGDVTPRDTSVVVGSDVTLRVMPNNGYHISQLDVDGNLISNYASNEIIFRDIHEDHNVTISFFPNSVEDEVFAGLSIYPNPNNGHFTVNSEDFEGDVTFQIYSVSGSLLNERTANGEQTVSFDNVLPAGTYFLRIISGDKVVARKIVVE